MNISPCLINKTVKKKTYFTYPYPQFVTKQFVADHLFDLIRSVVDPDRGRIRIILPDPDRHPVHADPDSPDRYQFQANGKS
jgi:hypothetical protein